MKRFGYICLHNIDDELVIDDFTLFADVISSDEETVTYKRYQNFGELVWEEPVTVSKEDFDYYYKPLTDEQYLSICEVLKG